MDRQPFRKTTGLGLLPLGQTPVETVTFASRAIRPLPAGRVQVEGSYAPPTVEVQVSPVALTWAHRDRLGQTSALIDDFTAGDLGPEPEVTYRVRLHWIDPDSGTPITPPHLDTDVGAGTSHD